MPGVPSASMLDGHLSAPKQALTQALTQALDRPLNALRASMETLGQEVLGARDGELRMGGVLREVERLGDNVHKLVEFASPPVPCSSPCTLEEILRGARARLEPEQRSRVLGAQSGACELHVDGPLLTRCLHRLLENALEASPEFVLVVLRCERELLSLSVIDDAPGNFAAQRDWQPLPFHTTKPNHLGLGLVLTQRDIALLNGRLEFFSSPGGETCVRMTIPVSLQKENP